MNTRHLTLIIAAILLAFGIYVYNFPPELEDDIDKETKDFICSNYSTVPMSELKVAMVHKMARGYKQYQGTAIQEKFGMRDAESIWFDLETLKTFLYHLEWNTKRTDSAINSEDLGVRIYYASYPDKSTRQYYSDLDDLRSDYEGRHTVMMIPTLRKGTLDFDFNPLDYDTFSNGLGAILAYENAESSNPQNTGGLTGRLEIDPKLPIGAQNHGTLIPPGDEKQLGF